MQVIYFADPELYGIPGSDSAEEYIPCNYFTIPGVRHVLEWAQRETGAMPLEGVRSRIISRLSLKKIYVLMIHRVIDWKQFRV